MAKDDPIIRSAPRRPEESTDLEKRRRLLACPTDILGIVGFGLYLAWFYLVMSCSITSGAGISHAAGSLLVAAFLLGESLAAIVIASSARRLASRKAIKAIVVASAILLAAPEITVLLTDAEIPLFATWFLSGFGAVLLLSLWGVFLSKLAHLQACGYTSVSALVAVSVLGFTRICLKPYMISVGGLLIVLASLGALRGLGPFRPLDRGHRPFREYAAARLGRIAPFCRGDGREQFPARVRVLRAFYLGVFRDGRRHRGNARGVPIQSRRCPHGHPLPG